MRGTIGLEKGTGYFDQLGKVTAPFFYPPTRETTALAGVECVTVDANSVSDGSTRLRRISLTDGWLTEALA